MSAPPEEGPDLLEGAGPNKIARSDPFVVRLYDNFTELLFTASMAMMLTIMTLLIGMDVILRVFLGTPIRGTHDMVGLCLLMLFLLGLPHSWRGGYHVRMDMVYGAMPDWLRRLVDIFASLAAIVFAVILAYQAWRYIPHFQRVGSSSVTLGIPYWPFTIAIMISAILFAISVTIDLAMTLFSRRRQED